MSLSIPSRSPVAAAALVAGICALAGPAAANVTYQCATSGTTLLYVTIFDEQDIAQVLVVDETTGQETRVDLPPAETGSGFRYLSGNFEFRGQGTQSATLTGWLQRYACEAVAVTEPGGGAGPQPGPQPGQVFIPGFSFGGNLRAGPGTEFADVGSTVNGQPVTMLSDAGVTLNGYSWWLVQLANGQQAHQWGGLLCAPGTRVAGIFNEGC